VRDELTSHPTTRNAAVATRAWLLKQHGPVCAYCGTKFAARTMTLDHVAPRRGQKAYDRRDNLVLACRGCNTAKRDLAPLAFMLGVRSRAANLVRFGAHLSTGLLDLARSLLPADETSGAKNIDHDKWGAPTEPDEDSPYRD
jgi:HNH endonuclease